MSKSQNAARSAGKLIVLTSHPIQYQAPLWRALSEELGEGHEARGKGQKGDEQGGGVPFEVWFLTDQGVRRTEDRDFGKAFAWDVDLLSGYPHRFLELRGKWDMRKFDGIPLARPIRESLREAGATALWVEGWRFKPFWDAVSAAKRMGIPVFLRGETSDKIAEKGGIFGLVRNFALHRLFAKVNYFLAIGQASRRFYLKHGVVERKLVDAPYGVDNEFFRREADGRRQTANGKRTEENSHEDAQEAGGGSASASARPNDSRLHSAPAAQAGVTRESIRGEAGVSVEQCFGGAVKAESIRKEWNIPLNAKVVMFCGKFVRKKRPLDVVEAAALSMRHTADGIQAGKPWHLLFVGSGELGDELRAACEVRFDADCQNIKMSKSQNAIAPPASFAGFLNQSQISKAYAVADVVVLPSEAWETWGLVVNEATAAGVPTVVSDRCGCSEDFAARNPYTRVFPMGDVLAMARSIEEVLALEAPPEEVTKYAEAFSPRVTAQAVAVRLRGRRHTALGMRQMA